MARHRRRAGGPTGRGLDPGGARLRRRGKGPLAGDARRSIGPDGWRFAHIVRGVVVSTSVAILEYEASYRRYLRDRPALVRFLVETCGNVYDYAIDNVHDDDYDQPRTPMNHYQDISVRRVIAELVADPGWPDVVDTATEDVELIDLGTGASHNVPRARVSVAGISSRSANPTRPVTC